MPIFSILTKGLPKTFSNMSYFYYAAFKLGILKIVIKNFMSRPMHIECNQLEIIFRTNLNPEQ